jgi:arylsulfatase
MTDLWMTEAQRNDVLPVSDGLVDRLNGFIPPAWPAGPSRTFRPGGGPVVDESVPLLWGGFRVTADVETGAEPADGVVFALGDRFGGYALYVVAGRVHFTFARSVDTLELASASILEPGEHQLGVSYGLGPNGTPGRMVLLVGDDEVDEIAVEGMLPLALQHGGAGLRIGSDSGFPVSSRYRPPAPFSGVVHQVRIDAPGSLRPAPEDEIRVALHAD